MKRLLISLCTVFFLLGVWGVGVDTVQATLIEGGFSGTVTKVSGAPAGIVAGNNPTPVTATFSYETVPGTSSVYAIQVGNYQVIIGDRYTWTATAPFEIEVTDSSAGDDFKLTAKTALTSSFSSPTGGYTTTFMAFDLQGNTNLLGSGALPTSINDLLLAALTSELGKIQGFNPQGSSYDIRFGIEPGSLTLSGSSTTPVPEPSTLLLLGSGLSALALWGRKKIGSKS